MPSLVSGEFLVFLDPHKRVWKDESGRRFRLKPKLVLRYPDQCAPYHLFDCNLRGPYKGTLFRFPLRRAQSDSIPLPSVEFPSELSPAVPSTESIIDLFTDLRFEAHRVLLFLTSVRALQLWVWRDGQSQPEMLYGVHAAHHSGPRPLPVAPTGWNDAMMTTVDTVSPYAGIAGVLKEETGGYSSLCEKLVALTPAQLAVDPYCGRGWLVVREWAQSRTNDVQLVSSSLWLVVACLGGGSAAELGCSREVTQYEGIRFVPRVAVAALISETKWGEFDESKCEGRGSRGFVGAPFEGLAFCSLPLPLRTGLPVHTNGWFELSDNRRELWSGEDMGGKGALLAKWNRLLLADGVAVAYKHALLMARDEYKPMQSSTTQQSCSFCGKVCPPV